jgi:hypothetical protein
MVRALHRCIAACAGVSLLLSSCAAPPTRSDHALRHIDATVHAFYDAHPRQLYPRSLAELSRFATSRGRPLDLQPFTKITLARSEKSMSIHYEVPRDPVPSTGVLRYGHLH